MNRVQIIQLTLVLVLVLSSCVSGKMPVENPGASKDEALIQVDNDQTQTALVPTSSVTPGPTPTPFPGPGDEIICKGNWSNSAVQPPTLPAEYLVDQNCLMEYFNAETSKEGTTTGILPDGVTKIEFIDNVWVIRSESEADLVFNPLFVSESGKPFGPPIICEKNVSGKTTLMMTITDTVEKGAHVPGASIKPAFKSASEIAAEYGYSDENGAVKRIGIGPKGQLIVFGEKDIVLAELKYAAGSPETIIIPAMPMINVEGVQVPDLKVSSPELFDVTKLDSPIPQFINAMKILDIEVDPSKINEAVSDLKNYQTKNNGSTEFTYTASIDGINYSMIFIYDKETNQWREKNLLELTIPVGLDLSSSDTQTNYPDIIQQNASYMFIGGPISPDKGQIKVKQNIDKFLEITGPNNIPYFHAIFYPKNSIDKEAEENIPKYVEDRIDYFLKISKERADQGAPIILNLVNEANSSGYDGFDPNFILYKLYGNKLLSKIYTQAYNKADSMGLIVGQDVIFSISDSFVLGDVKQTNVVRELNEAMDQISIDLGIEREKIPLIFAAQLRIDNKHPAPSVNRFDTAIEQLQGVVGSNNKIFITEIRVADTSSPKEITDTLDPLLKTAKKRNVAAIMFEAPFRIGEDPAYNRNNIRLFTPDNKKSIFYYYLLGSY